jgi:hypothetical protein
MWQLQNGSFHFNTFTFKWPHKARGCCIGQHKFTSHNIPVIMVGCLCPRYNQKQKENIYQKNHVLLGAGAHTCKPSSSEGRDQEDLR